MKNSENNAVAWIILAFAVILGTAVRWTGLDWQSLWFDEIVSYNISNAAWADFFKEVSHRDSCPPLFVFAGKFWTAVFGSGETALRSLSALIGTLALGAVFYLGKVYGGFKTAVAAVVLACLHGFAVYYSREFRAYMLLFALTALSLALFSKWLSDGPVSRRHAFLSVLVSVLLCYTHYYGLLVIVFECIVFTFYPKEKGQEDKIKLWWRGKAFAAALFGLWLPGFADHAFYLEQFHLSKGIDAFELISTLSPLSLDISIKSLSQENLRPAGYAFLAVFILSLVFFKGLKGWRFSFHEVRESLLRMKTDKSFVLALGNPFLIGVALIGASYFPFKRADDLPFFDWSRLACQGLVLLSLSFVMILCAYLLSGAAYYRDADAKENFKKAIPALIYPGFCVIVLALVLLTGFLFRPNYSERNMITILPSFLCAVAWVISKVKNRIGFTIALIVIFAAASPGIAKIDSYKTRVDSRGMAGQIKDLSIQLGHNPPVVVFSLPAIVTLGHYLKGHRFLDGRKDIDAKLKGEKNSFWVWHDTAVPPLLREEIESEKIINGRLKKYPVLLYVQRYGIMGALF